MSVRVTTEIIHMSDGQRLEAERFEPVQHIGTIAIMFMQGWNRPRNTTNPQLMAWDGFDAMSVSLQGHDGSDGDIRTVTRRDMLTGAIAAYDHYESILPPGTRIAVAGHSINAYTAALLTEQRPVAALSMRAAANYPDKGFDEPQINQGRKNKETQQWRELELDWPDNMMLRALRNFKGPIHMANPQEHEEDGPWIASQTIRNIEQAIVDRPVRNSVDSFEYVSGMKHLFNGNTQHMHQFHNILKVWLQKLPEPVQ